jgi:hypothetical protein
MRFRAALLLTATASTVGLTTVVATSANATITSFTATTSVTNRDDTGTNSNGTTNHWAIDAFSRVATISFHGLTTQSHCPGIGAGLSCYTWSGGIKDSGGFTTVVGDAVPGKGELNGGSAPLIGTAVTGTMTGKLSYTFYTDQNSSFASNTNVPTTLSGDSPSNGTWVELFFSAGVHFWDSSGNTGGNENLGTTGSWIYSYGFGHDSACPNLAARWVFSTADGGASPVDGNILAPDASHC